MRLPAGVLILVLLISAPRSIAGDGASPSNHTNKFRDREASDDMLGYPHLFAISIYTGRYISVRQVTGTWTARYWVVPPKIDRRRSIEGEKGKKKKKRKRRKKKKRRRRTYFPRDVLARAPSPPSPTGAFSPARGDGMPPHAGRKFKVTYLVEEFVKTDVNGSMPETNTSISSDNSVNASKLEDEGKLDSIQSDKYNGSSINLNNNTKHDISMGNVTTDNTTHIQRRLLEETDGKGAQDGHSETTTSAGATVENDQDLEEEADSSFDLFRDPEELADEYNYDYDDYVDESMWGDENWTEENHEKLEDYVSIDSHILCTPVSLAC
ncbi:hypothetical protein GW17_00030186 [Ensete ventricosum]|nr:hypothetical protein GW17_00030186 [Ensete ventricosum]